MNNNTSYERYQRQVILKQFGEAGQQKLLDAKVLVVGAGGLGCPVLQYLAAAGVGNIGIVDDDTVALSNLHRQVLYTVNDIGSSKADTAAKVLTELNPEITITAYNERLTTANTLELFSDYDIVIDGTDNFSTRYMINDACVLLKKPLVYGAISQFEGQVAIFNSTHMQGNENGTNYRDLFPVPPKDDEVLNCADAGVLGVLPGIIGTMMANETIKFITGIGESLTNQLMTYNSLNNQLYTLQLSSAKETIGLIPATTELFKQTNYDWLCAANISSFEIGIHEFNKFLSSDDTLVIDVRELDELPLMDEFVSTKIPLSVLKENVKHINEQTIVLFCQSGKRSLQAAGILSGIYGDSKKIYSLQGGIVEWKKQKTFNTV